MRNLAHSHSHTQATPAAQWDIAHGLNCKPSVSVQVVYNSVLQAIIPQDIQFIDNNNVRITFSQPFTGTARLV